MIYDLELNRIVDEIKEKQVRQVLIQLPDGLKPRAKEVAEHIEENTSAKVFIWLGSCYGSCDLPLGLDNLKIDLTIQFGHNRLWKEEW